MTKLVKNRLPSKKSNPINVFGCEKCSTLYIQYDNVTEMTCPVCKSKLDVFCTYKFLAFSSDLLDQIPGASRMKIQA